MREYGQRVTGWCLVIFFFLLPLKFGSLAMMPEQPPMFPADLLTLAVISWPPHCTGIAGALLLAASLLFFPAPSWRSAGALTALFWGLLLPLAALPGCLRATNWDYAWTAAAHWWGVGSFILSAWWIFSADPVWKKRTLHALAAAVLVTGIDGWRQYIWGFDEMQEMIRKQREAGIVISQIMEIRIMDSRVFASLGSCNTYGGFLLLTMPLVLALVRDWGKHFEPVKLSCILFISAAFILLGAPFLMTRSRGAWLCAFVTGGVWFFTRPGIRKSWKAAVFLGGLLLLCGAFFMMHRSGRGLLSGTERLDYLRTAAIMSIEHPLTGAGWGEFFHRHMKLKLSRSDESARSPHNLPASFAAQSGIPAGLIALAACGVLLFELFRRKSDWTAYRFGRWGILAFLLHSFMEINDAIPASVICCAAGALALMPEQTQEPPAETAHIRFRIAALCCGFAVACTGFMTNFLWVRSEAAFEALELVLRPRNIQEIRLPDPARVMAALDEAERLRPRSPYAVEMAGDFFFRTGDLENARRFFEASCARVPGRPAAHRRLASIACAGGERDLAREHLARARQLFPADPKNQEKRFFDEWEQREAFLRRK